MDLAGLPSQSAGADCLFEPAASPLPAARSTGLNHKPTDPRFERKKTTALFKAMELRCSINNLSIGSIKRQNGTQNRIVNGRNYL